jgi:RNA polymerase sigma factor (sigma-70 family)
LAGRVIETGGGNVNPSMTYDDAGSSGPTGSGHIGSFTAAFSDLFRKALKLGRRILGDQAAAEDVAAEAMSRAYAVWPRINTSDGYRTAWVLRVTTNLAIDVIRRQHTRELPADPSDLPDDNRLSVGAVDEQDAVAVRLVLAEALRALPGRQRDAVVLRYLGGLSQAEVAQALGVRPGTVATHVHRGLSGLRGRLADLSGGPGAVTELITDAEHIATEHIGNSEHTRGGTMKVSSLQEAARLQGTDTMLAARVTGVLKGGWGWTVDVGIPAVLIMRGRRCGADDDRDELVGQDIDCVVVEVDLARERMVVAPAVAADDTAEFDRRRQVVAGLRPGDVRSGRVHGLVPFGAFVDVAGVHGLIHLSELGESVQHPEQVLNVGQVVDVEVLDTDPELHRFSLRLRSVANR